MSMSILERRLIRNNYVLFVRDFNDENKRPVVSEMRVFDRDGNEIEELHTAVHGNERVEAIKMLEAAIRAHLKEAKAAKLKK